MPRTSPTLVLIPLVAAALSVAGCGSTAATTTDPVAWMNQVCGTMQPLSDAVNTEPGLTKDSTPKEVVGALSGWMGAVSTGTGTAVDGLGRVGASPVSGGDKLVSTLSDGLTTFKSSVEQAKGKVDALDPDSKTAVKDIGGVIDGLGSLQEPPDLDASIKADPALADAFGKAASCGTIKLDPSKS